jgi:hypothetical protein
MRNILKSPPPLTAPPQRDDSVLTLEHEMRVGAKAIISKLAVCCPIVRRRGTCARARTTGSGGGNSTTDRLTDRRVRQNLPFLNSRHNIISHEAQPTGLDGIMIQVVGHLQVRLRGGISCVGGWHAAHVCTFWWKKKEQKNRR